MSSNPPGSGPGQKTVFRPAPLGGAGVGAATAPQSPAIAGAGAERTVFVPQPQPHAVPAEPGPVPRAAAAVAPVPRTFAAQDDVPPLPTPMQVRNPTMAAAARLLALAAAVMADRQVADPAGLHVRASAEARAFEKLLTQIGLSAEDNARARYAVLATLDDIVQNLPGGVSSDWARQSLVVQSFGQSFGGDQFWTILDNMLARPAAYRDLLELYHACLAVGFQGRYRVLPDGREQLAARMGAIFATLSDIRPRPENDLVPAWQGQPTPPRKVGWLPQALLIGGAAAALLVLLFVALKLVLDSRDAPASLAIAQAVPAQPASIGRAAAPLAPIASGQLERIRARLTRPCIDATDDGATIRLVVSSCPQLGPALFDRGASEVAAAYGPVIQDAGRALAPEQGKITVLAHTDSDPISGLLRATYADNVALSEARAANAAGLLADAGIAPSRLGFEGRGDREPVDRADTPEAKAKNRRVEIVLPRSQ